MLRKAASFGKSTGGTIAVAARQRGVVELRDAAQPRAFGRAAIPEEGVKHVRHPGGVEQRDVPEVGAVSPRLRYALDVGGVHLGEHDHPGVPVPRLGQGRRCRVICFHQPPGVVDVLLCQGRDILQALLCLGGGVAYRGKPLAQGHLGPGLIHRERGHHRVGLIVAVADGHEAGDEPGLYHQLMVEPSATGILILLRCSCISLMSFRVFRVI